MLHSLYLQYVTSVPFLHQRIGTQILPRDEIVKRSPGFAVPRDEGAALRRDAERRNGCRRDASRTHRILNAAHDAQPQLLGIDFHVMRLRIEELHLLGGRAADLHAAIVDEAPDGGGADVQGGHVLVERFRRHDWCSVSYCICLFISVFHVVCGEMRKTRLSFKQISSHFYIVSIPLSNRAVDNRHSYRNVWQIKTHIDTRHSFEHNIRAGHNRISINPRVRVFCA